MAVYRYQAVCVGLWRGQIKRWNTTFHATNTSETLNIRNMLNQMCYPNPADVAGDCSGGVASITVYAAAGGAPIDQTIYFDWQSPSTWIPFTGDGWTDIPAGTPVDGGKESALMLIGHLPGLSASGKPMQTRKYLHAVPSRTAADYSDPDVSATNLASLKTYLRSGLMRNPAGVQPESVEVLQYYGNHQRVRGRRRTTRQVAADSFSAGVIVGAQPSASGSSAPAQFR